MNGSHIKAAVHQLLLTKNCAVASHFDSTCHVPEAASEQEAIALVNCFWRDLLGRQPYDTMEARSFLVDDCSFDEWMSLLERGIIPEVCR